VSISVDLSLFTAIMCTSTLIQDGLEELFRKNLTKHKTLGIYLAKTLNELNKHSTIH
jgi:hypothetical protein